MGVVYISVFNYSVYLFHWVLVCGYVFVIGNKKHRFSSLCSLLVCYIAVAIVKENESHVSHTVKAQTNILVCSVYVNY